MYPAMRDELLKVAVQTRVFYHGTRPSLHARILKEGLDPSMMGTGFEGDPNARQGEGVSLSLNPEHAQAYANLGAMQDASGPWQKAKAMLGVGVPKPLVVHLPADFPLTEAVQGAGHGGFDEFHATKKIDPSFIKSAEVVTTLLPHQQRVVDRITRPDQSGLVVVHGLGSGKTLTSIAAQEALGQPATVVVPAALHENYRKEVLKHTTGENMPELSTLQRVSRGGFTPRGDTLTIDEAHKLRESSTRGHQAISQIPAKKRLLLTASPFYNHPADISTLVNMAAGDKKLPVSRADFSKKYIREREVDPGLLKRIFTSQTKGTVEELNPRTAPELKQLFSKYVDRYPGSTEGFPKITRQTVKVPMDDHQLQVYDSMMGKAPPWVSAKVKAGLPPSKSEAKQLNAFLGAVRQVSNTTAPFEGDPLRAKDPKIRAASQELMRTLKEDPSSKAVVYSNFLAGGIEPYKQKLDAEGVPYGEFTGQMKKQDRDQMVRDYNDGKVRTLLLSSAGGEGLDLKGTRLMQILDPHWNEEKIKQVEGRGARYKSHSHLPEEKQTMTIQRYISTRPKSGLLERLGVSKPGKGVDEYLSERAGEKERLIGQFRGLM